MDCIISFEFELTDDANLVYRIKDKIKHLNDQGRMNQNMEMYRRSVLKFLSSLDFPDPKEKKKFVKYCNINPRLLQKVDMIKIPSKGNVSGSNDKKKGEND